MAVLPWPGHPSSACSRLPGGTLRSSSLVARSMYSSFRAARAARSGGNRLVRAGHVELLGAPVREGLDHGECNVSRDTRQVAGVRRSSRGGQSACTQAAPNRCSAQQPHRGHSLRPWRSSSRTANRRWPCSTCSPARHRSTTEGRERNSQTLGVPLCSRSQRFALRSWLAENKTHVTEVQQGRPGNRPTERSTSSSAPRLREAWTPTSVAAGAG